MKPARSALSSLTILALSACGGGGSSPVVPPTGDTPPPAPEPVSKMRFSDLAIERGLRFTSGFSSGYDAMPRHFAGGAAAGDIDHDGDIDLFIVRGDLEGNLLFINEGGSFTDSTPQELAFPGGGSTPLKLSGPTFADMDGDGHLDLFVGGLNGDPSFLFAGDGAGNFTDVTSGSGIDGLSSKNTISAAFGDYDRDGDADMALAHWGTPRSENQLEETETLWRNNSSPGTFRFTPVSVETGIADGLEFDLSGKLGPGFDYTFAPSFSDVNGDDFPDLLMVSDFRGSKVFLNNQDGTFTDATDRTQITDTNGMGAAVGDYDNDGDLDWFVSSINGNRLYENMAGTLIDVSKDTGVEIGDWGWGSCFADFNADGHLDIYQTNGWINDTAASPTRPFTSDKTRLWIADGNGNFTDQAPDVGVADEAQGRGVVCADFDSDGDVDILLLLNAAEQGAMLWLNQLQDGQTLGIDLVGKSPNTQALGAKIRVTTGALTQMRDTAINSNFTSHNPTQHLFGLGDAAVADEVTIIWPDGSQTVETNVAAGQSLSFVEP